MDLRPKERIDYRGMHSGLMGMHGNDHDNAHSTSELDGSIKEMEAELEAMELEEKALKVQLQLKEKRQSVQQLRTAVKGSNETRTTADPTSMSASNLPTQPFNLPPHQQPNHPTTNEPQSTNVSGVDSN